MCKRLAEVIVVCGAECAVLVELDYVSVLCERSGTHVCLRELPKPWRRWWALFLLDNWFRYDSPLSQFNIALINYLGKCVNVLSFTWRKLTVFQEALFHSPFRFDVVFTCQELELWHSQIIKIVSDGVLWFLNYLSHLFLKCGPRIRMCWKIGWKWIGTMGHHNE